MFIVIMLSTTLEMAVLVSNPSFFNFFIFDGISGIIAGFFLIMFIKSYETQNINLQMVIIATFFATMSFFFSLMTLVDPLIAVLSELTNGFINVLINLIIPVYYLYTMIIVVSSAQRIKNQSPLLQKTYLNHFQAFTIVLFGAGTTIISTAFALFPLENHQLPQTDLVFIWVILAPKLAFLIAFWLFYKAFIQPKSPAVFQPQRIEKILIISKEGLPLFDLNANENDQISDTLLSGAITAIKAVLKEATQITGDLRSISIGEHTLMFKTNSEITIILFTKEPTTYIEETLPLILEKVASMDLEQTDELEKIIQSTILRLNPA